MVKVSDLTLPFFYQCLPTQLHSNGRRALPEILHIFLWMKKGIETLVVITSLLLWLAMIQTPPFMRKLQLVRLSSHSGNTRIRIFCYHSLPVVSVHRGWLIIYAFSSWNLRVQTLSAMAVMQYGWALTMAPWVDVWQNNFKYMRGRCSKWSR